SLAPQITIVSPQSGTVLVSSAVSIKASIQDRGGKTKAPSGIQKVEFFVDDVKLGEVPGNSQISGTYECPTPWNTDGLKPGSTHIIRVRATDNLGQSSDATLQVILSAEWTILIYADAHNDLGQALLNHLNDLITYLPSTKGVNILILAGLPNGDSVIWLHNGTQTLSPLPNFIDFGDPSTLSNFILSSIQAFPAKKYLLHLWDHGSGWRKRAKNQGTRDICFDEIFNDDGLTIPELKQALQTVVNKIGRKIDLLFLNACVMGAIEVDYELKDLVSYCVSSEANFLDAPLWGEAYSKLVSNPAMSPADLGITIADTYYKQAQGQSFATIAVKDYSRIDNIANDIYYFAHYLRDCLPTYANRIMDLRDQTTRFQPFENVAPYYIDLYEFAYLVANNTSYDKLKTSAQNLMNDIKVSTLLCKFFGVKSAQGYSIFFPSPTDWDPNWQDALNKYSSLDFVKADSGQEWIRFLVEELQSLGKGARVKSPQVMR
ncbi:hypothetical protein H5T87_11510, partial [bacterium]|nr:hypothetical protein [bacterium]